jgi:pimeloyl-ACP methyl ester carboxylesterase
MKTHFQSRSIIAAAALVAPLVLLSGCATPLQRPIEAAPAALACPQAELPANTKCLRGQDSAGAHYLIAMPEKWSGVLVVHAHGGPVLGEPKAARADEDINRWSITVREGHAWAGSVFRQGGFAVTSAAEDTERVRRIFIAHVAKPRTTLLHGQSWGAMVATRAAEMFPKSWNGMLLTSGVVGGPAMYDFRIDMRAIYQYLCNNHPRPDEPAYPLSIGLPNDSKLTNAELTARVNECLALNKPAAQRTPEQLRKIKTIVDVVKIPESSINGHMTWATFTLRDAVQKVGGPPFGNVGVRYSGSNDDAALNAGVSRWAADAAAAARFAKDADHNGRFIMPVLQAHAINDATAFVEGGHILRTRMEAAGNGARVVQTFIESSEHSYWGDAHYPPLFEALLNWVEKGEKPNAAQINARCPVLRSSAPSECKFRPEYVVKPLTTRVPTR